MLAVPIANEWIETVKLFGDVQNVVKEALRAYSIEQCQQRIKKAVVAIARYNQKYRCEYETFKRAIQTDEDFLTKVEAQNPLWEEDAMEWEYWIEEKQIWLNRLCDILRR